MTGFKMRNSVAGWEQIVSYLRVSWQIILGKHDKSIKASFNE